MSSKGRGILGPELGRNIRKDVIRLSANQNRRMFQKEWDSKSKMKQKQMEWEGLGEERGEEGSEEMRAASSQMGSEKRVVLCHSYPASLCGKGRGELPADRSIFPIP